MTKTLPKKWFPCYTARISLKKVDKWAEYQKKMNPYFDTWEEAHAHMLSAAEKRLEIAKRDLKSATRHVERVRLLKACIK